MKKKIVIEVCETTYDKLVCIVLSQEKSFSQIILEAFEKDREALEIYHKTIQQEFEKLTRDEI